MLPRERWTDQRLDQFEKRVDERFDRVDERFDRFEKEVNLRFQQVDERFDRFEGEVNLRFQQVDKRFDRVEADIRELRVIMIGGFVTLLAAIIGTSAF